MAADVTPAPPPPSPGGVDAPWYRRVPWAQEAGLVIVVVLLAIFLTVFARRDEVNGVVENAFANPKNLIGSVMTYMSWLAVMAIGATCVIIAGGIDISIGSIFGLSALACAAALLALPPDANPALVVAVGVVTPLAVGALCGFINGAIVVGLRMHPFIVTLGTLSIFRGIGPIAVPMQTLPSGDRPLPPAFTEHFVGQKVTLPGGLQVQPAPLLIMLACLVVGLLYLAHTVGGRQLYAVGGNEQAARFSGLPVNRIKLRVYVISGLAAGVAGMISTGFFRSANTSTGRGDELLVIASAVVGGASLAGGRGTALGAVLGALIIKLIENAIRVLRPIDVLGIRVQLKNEYTMIIVGASIIIAVAIDRFSDYLHRRRLARRGAAR